MEDSKQKIINAAKQYATYIVENIPQKSTEGEVKYYFSGSLAMLLLSSAETIKSSFLDGKGRFVGRANEIVVSKKAKDALLQGVRNIGIDVDVVTIDDNCFDGMGKIYNLSTVRQNCDLATKLCPAWGKHNGTMYFDMLSDERKITGHDVAEIITKDGNRVYVSSPISLIMHKFADTIVCLTAMQRYKRKDHINLEGLREESEKYVKDISDFTSMFNCVVSIYPLLDFEGFIKHTLEMCPQTAFSRVLTDDNSQAMIKLFINDAKGLVDDKGAFLDFARAITSENERLVNGGRGI